MENQMFLTHKDIDELTYDNYLSKEIGNKKLFTALCQIAEIMKMKRIAENTFRGEYGTRFKMTKFGFVIKSALDTDL